MNNLLYYVEASVFCIILLFIFLYKNQTSIYREQQQIFFARALLSQILYIVIDIIWFLQYKEILHLSPTAYFMLNFLQWFLASFCGYLWFIYSESNRRALLVEKKSYRRMIFSPVYLAAFLILSSRFWGFPMKVNADGSFQSVNYYSYMMILPFLYIGASGIRALAQYFREDPYNHQLLGSGLYSIIIIVAGFAQSLLLEIPLLCYAYVIDMLIYYINMQDNQISLDSLTHLNNRNSLRRALQLRFRESSMDEIFYLFMIDIDYFKSINDSFGHPEGDRALKILADALRAVSRTQKENCFIARYGGDEFMMICNCKSDSAALQISRQIQHEVRVRNKKAGSPYSMEVSVGYIRRDRQISSIPELIRLADQKLYRYKHVRQVANRA